MATPTQDPMFVAYTGATSSAPFGLTDVGSGTSLTFADIDADGDLDAFVGTYTGNTFFFRNNSSAGSAAFAAPSSNPFGLTDVGYYAVPTLVDIDGDGDLDAFVGEEYGSTLFFRNDGTASGAAFTAAAQTNPFGLADVGKNATPTFVDINGDGDLDAFVGNKDGNMLFFANTGSTGSPAFAAAQTDSFGLVDVGLNARPIFVDIDGDGDLDAFVGEKYGSTLFFRNTGTVANPQFAAASTNPFGLASVGSIATPGLAAPNFVDIDSDGDLDALIGNKYGETFLFLNPLSPGITMVQTGDKTTVTEGAVTGDTYTIQLATQPKANVTITLLDVNKQLTFSTSTLTFTSANWNVAQTVTVTARNDTVNEGAHKAVIGYSFSSTDTAYNNLKVAPLQVAITDNDTPSYRTFFELSASSEPFGLTDVGSYSNPTLVDIDADGDLDAFVGNNSGNTLFFRNDGNASSAAFTAAAQTNPFGLTSAGTYASPTFVDIDGDGDLDAFVGKLAGDILFFRNTGSAGSAAFSAAQTNPFGLTNQGSGASPTLVDIDADGDLDALVGNNSGNTLFFANTGNASSAAFAAPSTNPFGLASVGGYAAPTFVDIDGDGDLDALVGNNSGNTLLFLNTGSASAAAFSAAGTNPLGLANVGFYSNPTLVDIDADGDLDALVGNYDGQIKFFMGIPPGLRTTQTDGKTTVTEGAATGDTYTIKLATKPTHDVTITLLDVNKQLEFSVSTLTFTSANWDTAQTVTVTARNDTVNEGKHTAVIGYSVSSTDVDYNNLKAAPLQVTITDNDAPSYRPYFELSASSEPLGLTDVGNSATPVLVDIDADGDLDAFVGSKNGNTVFFANTGSASAAAFAASSVNPFGLADVGDYASPTFVDIDADGDLDALVGNNFGNTLFFRNTGSASAAAFAAASSNPFGLVDVGSFANPALVDIDGDGDLDVLVGNQNGNTVFFANTGSANSAAFAASSINPFGLTSVGMSASPTFVDIDGDGDLDALVGHSGGNTLLFRNTGSATGAAFAAAETNPFGLENVGYFASPTLVDIDGDGDLDAFVGNSDGQIKFFMGVAPGLTTTQTDGKTTVTEGAATGDTYTIQLATKPTHDVTITLLDVNKQLEFSVSTLTFTSANWNVAQTVTVTARDDTVNEGTHKAVIGYSFSSTDADYNNLKVAPLQVSVADDDMATYRPFFVASTSSDPFGLTDVGNSAKVVLVDIDTDGDLDAFVGNQNGDTLLFRNTGNASSAAFAAPSTNPFGLSDVGSKANPTFVDIDADGDLDVFVGKNDGNTVFFANTGSASAAAFASGQTNPFGLADVGGFASPMLVDIDGDGDLDAFVGNHTGNILFFANTGNASSAAFAAPSTNPFGLVDVGSFASPTFADIDGDGDLDAWVGQDSGNTLFFQNTGNASSAAFVAASTNPWELTDVGNYANPTLADIDADGDLDVLLGNGDGQIQFFLNVGPALVLTPSDDDTRVSEGSGTDSYTIQLSTRPTHDVTVTLSHTNGQITLDKTTLTFTSANWNVAQTVTVTARDDTVNEGAHAGAVVYSVSSTDTNYDGLSVSPQWVGVTDNDASTRDIMFTLLSSTSPFGLTDAGEYAAPTFADLDGDGDLDALVGNNAGQTLFYRNNGNASSAAFGGAQTNAFGLEGVANAASPVLVDIDGDGDLDAFIGQGVGTGGGDLLYFANTGSASSAAFAAASSGAFGLVDEGNSVSPVFADIDGDDDLDLLIGNADGDILLLANTGTVNQPAFAAASANPFGLGNVGNNATLTLADVDSDGDLDVLAGNNAGQWLYFANTGGVSTPAFAAAQTDPFELPDVGTYTRPVLVDIDADGDFDAFVGNADGQVRFLLGGNRLPTGSIQVLGTYQTGAYAWQAFASLQDEDGMGSLSYQWLLNGQEIVGATAQSLRLTNAEQARQLISVRVSYTDSFGTKESVTSSVTDLQLSGATQGGSGHDLLVGSKAGNTFYGQAGNDWYWINHSGDSIRESVNAGRDGVMSLLQSYVLPGNVEDGRIALETGASLTGNTLANSLTGGAGADTLSGGLGADTFVLRAAQDSTAEAPDTIVDFKAAQGDKIDLSVIDANTQTARDEVFSGSLLSAGDAFTAAGQLRLEVSGNNAILYGNTDNDADAEFAIALMGVTQLQAANLVL